MGHVEGWTARIAAMFTVYGMTDSCNCYKVKLTLEQLVLPYRWVEVDSARGETRSEKFLAIDSNAKVPVLALEDGARAILRDQAGGIAAPRRAAAPAGAGQPGAFGDGATPRARAVSCRRWNQPRHVPMPG
jgi:hypothetical protein